MVPTSSRSQPAATNPTSPTTTDAARSGWSNSASTTTPFGCTGPPTWISSSPSTSRLSSGDASPTLVSVRRLRTTPIAPSGLCSATSTTVRWKFGSSRSGAATSSLGAMALLVFLAAPAPARVVAADLLVLGEHALLHARRQLLLGQLAVLVGLHGLLDTTRGRRHGEGARGRLGRTGVRDA